MKNTEVEFRRHFSSFKTVEEVRKYMREYLLGKRKDNPTCYVPLHAETDIFVEGLVNLIDYGLIPTNSQPGTIDDGVAQRFYLELIVPAGFEHQLEKYIATEMSDIILTHAYSKEKVCLGSRVAVTKDANNEVFTWCCAISYDLDTIAEACPRKLKKVLKKNYCVIALVDPKWGREQYGLDFLLDFLAKQGIRYTRS